MIETLIIYQHSDPYDNREPEYQCPKCASYDVFQMSVKDKFDTKHVCRWCWHKDWSENFVKPN